jgi:hypothetical protein
MQPEPEANPSGELEGQSCPLGTPSPMVRFDAPITD